MRTSALRRANANSSYRAAASKLKVCVGLLGIVLLAAPVGLLFVPEINPANSLRGPRCISNLRNLGKAVLSYNTTYKCYPSVVVQDTNGRPLYSWRVLLLPLLEEAEMYEAFHLDEAWNSPHNLQFVTQMPAVYRCPDRTDVQVGKTTYVAVTGTGTVFPNGVVRTSYDITDGPENTLMFLEVDGAAVDWTAPHDLVVDDLEFRGTIRDVLSGRWESPHEGGRVAIFADGHSDFLTDDLPAGVLQAMTTIAGGEVLPDEY